MLDRKFNVPFSLQSWIRSHFSSLKLSDINILTEVVINLPVVRKLCEENNYSFDKHGLDGFVDLFSVAFANCNVRTLS